MYLIIAILLFSAISAYLFWRNRKALDLLLKKWDTKKKNRMNAVIVFVVLLLCFFIRTNAIIVLLHFVIISQVFDLFSIIFARIFTKKKWTEIISKLYQSQLLTIVTTICIFLYGIMNMMNVQPKYYSVTTDKNVQKYKIALLSDIHFDTIQKPELVEEKIKEINDAHVDFVVLAGDIVEENTTKESMKKAFQTLGQLESKCGIYYVYGNHDQQPYRSQPSYTAKELQDAILNNGIHILRDSYVKINDDLILAGRDDAAWGNTSNRASTEEILQGVNRNQYIIVIDHQPIGTEENSKAGVDLELSGHTHAGQIWPIGVFTRLTGGLNYGDYQTGKMHTIVSSGVAGWGFPVRTQGHSEYDIITIEKSH